MKRRERNERNELQCSKCLNWLSEDSFRMTRNKRGNRVYSYPSAECKKCLSERTKRWVQINRTRKNTWNNNKRHQLKEEFLKEYGGKCSCCEEYQKEFLTLDHIHGKPKKIQVHLELGRLKAAGWPKSDVQILCFNCNSTKGIYGSCPHTWEANEHRPGLNVGERKILYQEGRS